MVAKVSVLTAFGVLSWFQNFVNGPTMRKQLPCHFKLRTSIASFAARNRVLFKDIVICTFIHPNTQEFYCFRSFSSNTIKLQNAYIIMGIQSSAFQVGKTSPDAIALHSNWGTYSLCWMTKETCLLDISLLLQKKMVTLLIRGLSKATIMSVILWNDPCRKLCNFRESKLTQ